MKHLCIAAFAMLAGTAAQAQNAYNFEIDGRTIRIAAPRNCSSLSCLSVSIPGLYETRQKNRYVARADDRDEDIADVAPVPAPRTRPQPTVDVAPVAGAVPAQPRPAPAAPVTAMAAVAPPVSAPAVAPPPPRPQAEAWKDPTPAPVAAPAPAPQPVTQAEPSPLGIWDTEDRKGKVRIEACGKNLCGYAVNPKPSLNGKKVLIDMKQSSATKWGGQIYDPNSGSTYDSTVTLKAGDTLRVQGCAFGGLFCGGQTWTRSS